MIPTASPASERAPGFYWVLAVIDVDADEDWENDYQPAHWNGAHWTLLGSENENWPVGWVGQRIERRILADQASVGNADASGSGMRDA